MGLYLVVCMDGNPSVTSILSFIGLGLVVEGLGFRV